MRQMLKLATIRFYARTGPSCYCLGDPKYMLLLYGCKSGLNLILKVFDGFDLVEINFFFYCSPKIKVTGIKIWRSRWPLPIESTSSDPFLTVGAVEILLDWCC